MRFTPLIVAGLAGLATAQRMSDAVPDCAVECLEDGIQTATDCALDDGDCVCEVDNYRNTYDVIQACVLLACGAARSIDEVLPAAAGFCSSVTDGATAPPVDDSPSPTTAVTSSSGASQTPAPTTSEPTAESTPSPTDEPDAASAVGPAGAVGLAALGLGLLVLL
ncbi:hypothetical protein S7711_06206 [Stachybotrys chartarum IBT 7711]|uniref:CFEM domain-containing protein n=1 Tax=Stachybotrys chartarum (strain CBS 109288 / IBT 7711) TaxID=1280523 RepID=A0A084AW98_STACB|nr:hypothetical protein S7711_06206 [Stachybotrys chartarum IBT 7711]KFA49267.1 hypothetical protein S40293_08322 [Stachybotrys chartarum IBT 40293]KFA71472.1 hypothetical protein S40288_08008 [Stachybotrys chartarum IBT 40288]